MSENRPATSPQKPPARSTVSRWSLLMRRGARPWRAWTRHTFSRESLFSSIRTFFWVVPLTLLVWVYAEREQLETVPGAIKVEARNTDTAPREVTLMTTVINVAMTGPHAGIDRVKSKLENALQLDIPLQLTPGLHQLSTSALLANNRLFVENGVTVTSFIPNDIEVMIDPIETRPFEVQPPPDERVRLESFTFTPPTVEGSAPQSYFVTHPQRIAFAPLGLGDSETVGNLDKSVTLQPPDKRITLKPAIVTAKAVVKQQDVPGVVSMPLWIEMQATWDKYKVDLDVTDQGTAAPAERFTVKDVHIIGPPAVIKRINDLSETPRAVLDVYAENVPELPIVSSAPTNKVYTGKLRFQLPDKVKVAPVDADRTIQFKIVERKTTE